MFYTKSKLPGGRTVKTEITDENVFTRCPECGRELSVDLDEILTDGEGCLLTTSITCPRCTAKRQKKTGFSVGVTVTPDGINLLTEALNKAGYAELICDLFMWFGIDGLKDLTPEQYGPFAEALLGLAVGDGGL